MFSEGYLRQAILAAPAILFALTVHEYFHAWMAFRFGDTTARDQGRLTLNPLAHLDLFGTLMLFLSNFRFGWAKPVPVNPYRLRNPRTADFWISAAGPLSNFGLAFIFGMLLRMLLTGQVDAPEAVHMFLYLSVLINVSLGFFNLIPIFPLDGSHILRSVLPPSYEGSLDQLERFGPFILIILVVTGVFGKILGPFISIMVSVFSGVGL